MLLGFRELAVLACLIFLKKLGRLIPLTYHRVFFEPPSGHSCSSGGGGSKAPPLAHGTGFRIHWILAIEYTPTDPRLLCFDKVFI